MARPKNTTDEQTGKAQAEPAENAYSIEYTQQELLAALKPKDE